MASIPQLTEIPSSLTEAAFWRLFGRLEHERLDFKRGVPSDIRDAIAAMAMTHGGLIVHGVDDNRNVTGCPLSQNTQDRITRIASECGVDVQLREIAVGQRKLTICAVPEVRGRIVTTPDGRLLRRVGGDSQPLRGDAMARFVRERELRSGEDEPLVTLSASAFDLPAINEALAADGQAATDANGVLRALTDLGVAVAAPPPLTTNVLRAAAILFASQPRTFIRGAAVQLVRRPGPGPGLSPVSAREECGGPLAETVACCLNFVSEHSGQFQVVTGIRRETLPDYPVPALREAIVNALAHRDYGLTGATVDITLWDDRVEVRSPGPLPGHITLGNIREEHYSRNPRIMRVLKTLGLVEEYGEGIDRMYSAMEARLMPPPRFEATPGSVTVTLLNRSLADIEDQAWLMAFGDDVTANERRMLAVARRDGAAAPRDLRNALPKGADINAILKSAVNKGLLLRVGQRGGSRYMLGPAALRASRTAGTESRKRQRLLEEIRRRSSMTTAECANLLQCSASQVRKVLDELLRAGLVHAEGNTRGRRYLPR